MIKEIYIQESNEPAVPLNSTACKTPPTIQELVNDSKLLKDTGPDTSYTIPTEQTEWYLIKKPEALRYNNGKLDWSLFPFESAEEIVKVLEFGAKKYAAWNFTVNGGLSWKDCCSSILRHTFAFMRGEDNDPESGLSHIAHVGCNVLFLLTYIRNRKEFNKDDRNKRV